MRVVRLRTWLTSSIILGILLLVVVHTMFPSSVDVFFYSLDIEPLENETVRDAIVTALSASGKFKLPVRDEKNIIFLETTCILNSTAVPKGRAKLVLTNERACAIESAARTNPNSNVYLFYSCPLDADSLQRADALVKKVLEFPNVFFWHQSVASIFADTPLEGLYNSGKLRRSWFPQTHGSDVLRFLLLWKFGGVYLDMDFIVMRSLDSLGPNFVGAEERTRLNSAALGLASSGLGAQIARECIHELSTDFRGYDWGHNGPGLITRIMRRTCDTDRAEQMTAAACEGFNVLPESAFYPIHYSDWRQFYSESASEVTMSQLASTHAVHVWNSMKVQDPRDSSPVHIERGSRQPIALLHQTFCPGVNQIMIDSLAL